MAAERDRGERHATRGRRVLAILCLGLFPAWPLHAGKDGPLTDIAAIESLPVAAQTGPSCAFFANLPMVAWTTGFDVSGSPAFLRAVYGLRRGDFEFRRSFDKRVFCKLFSLPYELHELRHLPAETRNLRHLTDAFITRHVDDGLMRGQVHSLRVNGAHGGPHNVLLMGRKGGRYLVHDPRGGRLRQVERQELVEMMLVRSTLKRAALKPEYINQLLSVRVPAAPPADIRPLSAMASELQVVLSGSQRAALAKVLLRPPAEASSGPGRIVAHHPEIDYAVLSDDKGLPRSVIDAGLEAQRLTGVAALARLAINAFHRGKRSLLPVMVLDGRPWLVTGYAAGPGADGAADWIVDDGIRIRRLPEERLLALFKESGAFYGTMALPQAGPGPSKGPDTQ